MNYKEKSDVDNVEMRVTCSNCGLAASECHCPDQAPAGQDNPVEETTTATTAIQSKPPAASENPLPIAEKDEAKIAQNDAANDAAKIAAQKTNHVYGAGVFFRWRLALALLAVTILTAIGVFATTGEDLPFLWTMATRFADPDRSVDHFVSTVVRSASPHNRPFFLLFASVLRVNHVENDNKNLSQATKTRQRLLQLVQAQKEAREAAALFKERNDPRFEAAAISMAIATSETLRSDSSQDLARLADLVALKDLPKSEGPRFSKFFSFGEILEPYECLISISLSSSDVKEAKYEAALYQHVLDSIKDEHDKKEYELLFAYSHTLLVSGDREKAIQIRKQAIKMGSSNNPLLANQLTGRLADTVFRDAVATGDWQDAKTVLNLRRLAPSRRQIGLAFCCFANGEDAAGKHLIDQINDDMSGSPGSQIRNYIQSLPVRRQDLPALAKVYNCLLSSNKYTDASLVAQSVVCQSAAGDKKSATSLLKRERHRWANIGIEPHANQRANRIMQLELGTLFLVCDDVKNARATFEQLQRLDQELGASKDTLSIDRLYIGLCDLRSGKIAEARCAFEQVRKSNPKMAGVANLELAKLLIKAGKTKEAQALLTTVMQLEDGMELDGDSLLPNEQFYLEHVTVCADEELAALYISEEQYTKAAEVLKQLEQKSYYDIDATRFSGMYRVLLSKGITIDGWAWKSMQANPSPEIKSLFDRFISPADTHLLLDDFDDVTRSF